MASSLDRLRVLVAEMSENEFQEAVRVLRDEADRRRRLTLLAYRVGDRVWFEDRYGHRISGVVERVNAQTVSLRDHDGRPWRVAPEFLHPEATRGAATEAPAQ